MKTSYEALSKQLGALDKERRAVLTKLKQTPEYALQHLKQVMTGLVTAGLKRWYTRTNDKGQTAYFNLVGFEILPTTTAAKINYRKTKVVAAVDVTPNNSVLTKIRLKWKLYDYGAVMTSEFNEEITISIFNEIEPQVLNGRKEAVKFDEKTLIKASLAEKKKVLEDQLKKIKNEIALIK